MKSETEDFDILHIPTADEDIRESWHQQTNAAAL